MVCRIGLITASGFRFVRVEGPVSTTQRCCDLVIHTGVGSSVRRSDHIREMPEADAVLKWGDQGEGFRLTNQHPPIALIHNSFRTI